MNGLSLLMPEIVLALAALALLLASAWRDDKGMGRIALGGVAAVALTGLLIAQQDTTATFLNGMVATDAFRRFLKLLILVFSGVTLVIAPPYFAKENDKRAAFPVLVLLATLGMLLLVSAQDMIALYVALELQNLALYVLVSYARGQNHASEAGLKYVTLGAMASAILLFGLSLLFGVSGTTSLPQLGAFLSVQSGLSYGAAAGIALTLAGLAFKISAFPFHMWTPDVYEGAPTPVTAFLATAPKISVFGLLATLTASCLTYGTAAVFALPLFVALALASMALGALTGLKQTKIKRLMAYSAILNSGTLLIAFVTHDWASLLVYLAVYALATMGVLGGLSLLSRSGRPIEEIADLGGLSRTHRVMAVLMAICLFSLAGVPPLAGFFGKLAVLMGAVKAGQVGLAICAVLASVVAAFYYLKVVKAMFFDEVWGLPLDPVSERISSSVVALVAMGVAVFVLCPSVLFEAAKVAAGSLMVK